MPGFDILTIVTALFVSFMIISGFRDRKYSRKLPLADWLRSGSVLYIKVDIRKFGYQIVN
jgi:hypothetical protein